MAGIVCNNPRALEEYQERQHAIEDLRRDVASDEGGLAALKAEMEAVKVTRLGCRTWAAQGAHTIVAGGRGPGLNPKPWHSGTGH